ncbi:MAG TPA: hypothetical protein VE987_01850 [Polyangiaceae bacterium]|nr:hypothetical protein [Polyangiaceae bacterium]
MLGRRAFALLSFGLVGSAGWLTSSCAGGLHSATLVDTVRILASSADQPYAQPQSTVTVRVLAVDGRPQRPAPMTLEWLPFVCENPANDAYYACFPQMAQQIAQAASAPAGGAAAAIAPVTGCGGVGPAPGAAAALRPGTDLTPALIGGDCAQFTMPADAITSHASSPPAPIPYGLAILFNAACAGHLELVPLDPNNVQAPPIGCFDAQHNQLGPDDWVFGFTRVYAYASLKNENPVIDSIDVNGTAYDPQALAEAGFSVASCGGSCSAVHIGPVVDARSWELNPEAKDMNGNTIHEEIWADFFSTFGSFNSDARLLFDPVAGSVGGPGDTDAQFQPPGSPGDGTIWIIVHDNRGGASWASVPVHVTP